MVADQLPSLVGLAFHIGLGGLALRMERVEFLLEALIGRDAGVDRATLRLWRRRLHGASPANGLGSRLISRRLPPDFPPRPLPAPRPFGPKKNRWPFHFTPVMAKATAERLVWVFPFHAKPSSSAMTRSMRPCHSRVSRAPGFSTSGDSDPLVFDGEGMDGLDASAALVS